MNRNSARVAIIPFALIIFPALLAPNSARAQTSKSLLPIAPTTETLLSGADWKLGSFAMDKGEGQQAFGPAFDDRGFSTVTVPGEVQLQIGLKGMDLYYQSKTVDAGERKGMVVPQALCRRPKADAGKLMRLVFDGVDYFSTVWLNGEKLGEHEGCLHFVLL